MHRATWSVGTGLGLVRALGEGGRKADTAEILVRQLVASVQVSPDSTTVPQESLDTLTAVVRDANGYPIVDALVEWISDLISVATVAGGVVTPGDTGMTTSSGVDLSGPGASHRPSRPGAPPTTEDCERRNPWWSPRRSIAWFR
jgi:pyridoxal biosynthesis lyase PdxS